MSTEREVAEKKLAAGMYLAAAVFFLVLGVLGRSAVNIVFLVLSIALVVLSLNYWRSAKDQ